MGTERCAACGRALVIIELSIDGRAHLMASCSHCNTRQWRRGEDTIELGGVLEELSESVGRARATPRG